MRNVVISFVCVFGMLSAASASAQELRKPAPRQGYYIGGGPRLTLGLVDDDEVDIGGTLGFGAVLRFGQMTNEWLGLGLLIGGGGSGNSEWSAGGGQVALEGQVQPLQSLNLAIRGAVGFGAFSISRSDPALETDDDPSGGLGSFYSLGVSYDFFPWYDEDEYDTGGFAFTVFAEANLLPADGILAFNGVVGIELTYWFGLPKNKLDLPPSEAFKVKD